MRCGDNSRLVWRANKLDKGINMIPNFVKERELNNKGFDLYFAGAHNSRSEEYLQRRGANRLKSQLRERKDIEKWIANMTPNNKLFIDSGAYTAYTKGVSVDVDDYISYINSISDKITIFAQVDKIPGTFRQEKTVQEKKEAPAKSWENYLYMRARVKEPDKLIPIFHQGEDYAWLKNMLEWTDETGKHIPYIGISPAFDVPGLESFLDASFDIIEQSSNPNVKTHAFGMTRLKVLEQYPYYSADSTSWLLSAGMGSVYTPWGTIYMSDRKDAEGSYIMNQPKAAQETLSTYFAKLGFTMEEVRTDYSAQALLNIQYLLDWASNYRFKGTHRRKQLF